MNAEQIRILSPLYWLIIMCELVIEWLTNELCLSPWFHAKSQSLREKSSIHSVEEYDMYASRCNGSIATNRAADGFFCEVSSNPDLSFQPLTMKVFSIAEGRWTAYEFALCTLSTNYVWIGPTSNCRITDGCQTYAQANRSQENQAFTGVEGCLKSRLIYLCVSRCNGSIAIKHRWLRRARWILYLA